MHSFPSPQSSNPSSPPSIAHPLRHLLLRLLRRRLQIRLQLLPLRLGQRTRIQALVVRVDPTHLRGADAEKQGVDGSKNDVLGLDDEAPARPDGACAHEGEVLGQREGLCGAGEVGGACGDHGPFHYWGPGGVLVSYECVWVVWCGCGRDPRRWAEIGHRSAANGLLQHWKLCAREGVPEVNGLGANGRVPEPLEAGGLRAGCCGGIAAGVLGEVCAEGVEGAEAGAERHGGLLFYGRTVERERGAMCVWTVR